MTLQHRVALSSMIQFRTYAPYATGPQQASYYHDSQRGSTIGSLLITESTIISHDAGGCEHAIGMYTDAQIRSWRKVCIFSPVRSKRVSQWVLVDHRRRPCQGIVHLRPAWGAGSCRRPRGPRETRSAFAVCLRIVHCTAWAVEAASCVNRRRNQILHRHIRRSGA